MQIFGGKGRQNSGQFHAENCATFLAVVTENLSGVYLDDAEADAETQARAFANRLRRIERIEDAMRLLDAGAAVGKQDHDVGAVTNGFDGKNSAVGRFHGIQSVADDIEENLHQLIAIAADTGENGFKLQLDARGSGAQVERAELHGIVHHRVDVQERAFGGNLPGEA